MFPQHFTLSIERSPVDVLAALQRHKSPTPLLGVTFSAIHTSALVVRADDHQFVAFRVRPFFNNFYKPYLRARVLPAPSGTIITGTFAPRLPNIIIAALIFLLLVIADGLALLSTSAAFSVPLTLGIIVSAIYTVVLAIVGQQDIHWISGEIRRIVIG